MSRALASRRTFLLAAMIAVAPIAAAAVAQSSSGAGKAERELYRLEDAWAQAVVRRDAHALGRFVAPRWVYSDESGIMSRDAGIAAFTSGADTVREASNSEMRAAAYGNAAVVTGVLQMKGHGPNGSFTHRYRYTDTWVRMDGRWQCVASQDYLMPEGRP
jgi:ketosteroid isomerase-like protein